MKKAAALVIAAVSMFLLTGCFSSSWIITLNKDGSGTVDMKYRLDKQVIDMMQSMGNGNDSAPESGADLIEQQDLEEMAASMGEGVRYVSAEPLPEDDSSIGFSARFEFRDINTLGIDPAKGAPEQEQEAQATQDGQEQPAFTFDYTRGQPSELLVFIEQDDDQGNGTNSSTQQDSSSEKENQQNNHNSSGEGAAEDQEMMMSMMKPYFRSMSFLVQLKIKGSIRSTDASYRDGNTVTLMDMDMGKIVNKDELFKKVVDSAELDDKDVRKRLEEAGIRIETKDEVSVVFQ
jgi:hypothetical protein